MVYYQKCLFISKHTDSTYIDTDGKIHTSTKALYCTNHTHKHTQLWSFVERLCKPAEWTEERWVKWKTVIDRQLYWTWSLLSKCSHVLPILFIGRCILLKIIKNMLKHIKMHYCYLGIMKNLKSWIRVGVLGGWGIEHIIRSVWKQQNLIERPHHDIKIKWQLMFHGVHRFVILQTNTQKQHFYPLYILTMPTFRVNINNTRKIFLYNLYVSIIDVDASSLVFLSCL